MFTRPLQSPSIPLYYWVRIPHLSPIIVSFAFYTMILTCRNPTSTAGSHISLFTNYTHMQGWFLVASTIQNTISTSTKLKLFEEIQPYFYTPHLATPICHLQQWPTSCVVGRCKNSIKHNMVKWRDISSWAQLLIWFCPEVETITR